MKTVLARDVGTGKLVGIAMFDKTGPKLYVCNYCGKPVTPIFHAIDKSKNYFQHIGICEGVRPGEHDH